MRKLENLELKGKEKRKKPQIKSKNIHKLEKKWHKQVLATNQNGEKYPSTKLICFHYIQEQSTQPASTIQNFNQTKVK